MKTPLSYLVFGIFFLNLLPVKSQEALFPTKQLKICGKMSFPLINESSGMIQSRLWPDVLWTHNDSGDVARIFPIRKNGDVISPAWMKKEKIPYEGIHILGAHNIDWEDIAIDNRGNLYIGAFGNNFNNRRDLGIYKLREPHPFSRDKTKILAFYPFEYPDQKKIPAERTNFNFDSEALFFANDTLYILTKHRSDKKTKLYRFETFNPSVLNKLKLVLSFNIGGYVTAADVSKDENKLAILTFRAIWLFERGEGKESWFQGKISKLGIANGKQCEGICFFGEKLIVSNEQRELFEVDLESFQEIKK